MPRTGVEFGRIGPSGATVIVGGPAKGSVTVAMHQSSPPVDRPLVTFLVVAFRQERFIAEAVSSALAQTYSPLEIVLSDDCSPDGTFAIMERLAADYRGPHQVTVRRSERNLGLTAHLNDVLWETRGRLVVFQAGDDVAEPDRTAALADRWIGLGRPTCSLFSEYRGITEDGAPLDVGGGEPFRSDTSWQRLSDRDRRILGSYPGCTQAFTREAFEFFGPLPEDVVQEDICLQLRSAILGGIGFVARPLLRYRQTTMSQSRPGTAPRAQLRSKALAYHRSYQRVFDHFLRDCERAERAGFLSAETLAWTREACVRHLRPTVAHIGALEKPFVGSLKGLVAPSLPWRLRLLLMRNLVDWRA